MKEQLINFSTAKLAKEKGFDEIVDYIYRTAPYEDLIENYNRLKHSDGNNPMISAPTQALLQRWLRETHKIYVAALPSYTDTSDNKKHYFELFYGKTLRLFGDKYSYFPTYEEALEVGLFEA